MSNSATPHGGVKHGAAVLSHSERVVAQNALNKLNAMKSAHGVSPTSATVIGGIKSPLLAGSSLVHGHGSDTFVGGTRSLSTHSLANIGNDTVVSGSTTKGAHASTEARAAQSMPKYSLSNDTINVKGATAETVKGTHAEHTATGSHTMTLADKTTITVSGLSHHDISKLSH